MGESGSGKTTLLRALAMISKPSSGKLILNGELVFDNGKIISNVNGKIQMVFQDPDASLNPMLTVKELVREPLIPFKLSKEESSSRVINSLKRVGIDDTFTREISSTIERRSEAKS